MPTAASTTVAKAFQILELFREHTVLTSSLCEQELRIPRATAHRLLLSLKETGAVEQTRDGHYRLNLTLFELGSLASQRSGLEFHTLFNMASPTFKLRFMYMAGFESEEEFDRWAAELDLRPLAPSIDCPYLAVAGEDDELSPIEWTHDLLTRIPGPKELLLYQGEPHGLHTTTASALGPSPQRYIADWLRGRADGSPLESTRRFVDLAGNVAVEPMEASRR